MLRLSRLLLLCLWATFFVPAFAAAGSAAPARPDRLDESGGPTPRALLVEGEHDALRVPDHADLNPRSALTIELWVQHGLGGGCGTLVGKDRASGFWFGICDGRLRFISSPGVSTDGRAAVPARRWTHVAVTYDGATRRFYIDGRLDHASGPSESPLGRSASELVLGADATMGAVLPGKLDQVRLWSLVRSEAEIRTDALKALGARPGLVAEWSLDGDGRDLVGLHDGSAPNGGTFTYDGVLPRNLTVPRAPGSVTMDGRCDLAEYGSAERVALDGLPDAFAFVQATDADLHACLAGLPRATATNGVAAVYLDRDRPGMDPAQPGDYRFSIDGRGTSKAEEGDGAGGYRDLSLIQGSWQAARWSGDEAWNAELRIPRRFFDGGTEPGEHETFGLALSHASGRGAADERFWPLAAAAARPTTWSTAELAEAVGFPPHTTFTGMVVRPPDADGNPSAGIRDATVYLFGVEDELVTVLDVATTDSGGRYALETRGLRPETFLLREVDPNGMVSVEADAGPGGEAAGANLLAYSIDADAPEMDRIFAGGRFVDRIAETAPPELAMHYLIVHAPPVSEDDLWPIIAAKRRQGFQVELVATDDLERSGTGHDLAAKIQGWLKARWEAVEPAPVYALLVGRGDRIPFRDIGWLDNNHRDPARPDYHPAWPTDWYYADLDSDWDADGDRFYGELLGCAPGDTYPDPEAEEGERDCPEAGSLLREGPFGDRRSPDDDFQAEISVGRLALNEPGEVRRALEAAARAEASGAADKHHAVLAGGFWSFDGSSWVEARQRSVPGGDPQADTWLRSPWTGTQPFGHDSAEHLDVGLRALLTPFVDRTTRLYEATSPEGNPALVPTRRQPDQPLSPAAMTALWRDTPLGLAAVAGRGGPDGVYSARWLYDWNDDGRIDNPAPPEACLGQAIPERDRVGPPCQELIDAPFLGMGLPAPAGLAPIVVANAAGTGAVAWAWDGSDAAGNILGLHKGPPAVAGDAPARGLASAWVGALTAVQPGALDAFQSELSAGLLGTPLRLGDATWAANSSLARRQPHDLRSYGVTLFGDPAMAYWGDPADTAGAWPQPGRDGSSSGATAYNGPADPAILWSSAGPAPAAPVSIGRDGELLLTGRNRVSRYAPNGTLVAQADLGEASTVAPLLSTDGVYVATRGTVHVFDRALAPRDTLRLPGGAELSGPPRLGPDGTLWLPTRLGMARVTGAGRVELLGNRSALGPAAFRPNGDLVWTTSDGALLAYRMDRAGEASLEVLVDWDRSGFTAPAIDAEGTIYVGSTDGWLYAVPEEGALRRVDTGGPLQAPPAIGADGSVYAGNTSGAVLAFSPAGAERWRSELGAPVEAALAIDGSQVYVALGERLVALNLATGHPLWSVALGGRLDSRSAPVIGPDRTIYVLRADLTLVAVHERGRLVAPSGVTLTPTGPNRATVRWRDNSEDETGFRVELCDREGACTQAGITASGATSLVVTQFPVEPGRPFRARVQALGRALSEPGLRAGSAGLGGSGSAGGEGPDDPRDSGAAPQQAAEANLASEPAASDWATVAPAAPAAPVELKASATASDAIALSWRFDGDPGQLVGFEVQRRSGSANFAVVGLVGADARRFDDLALAADTAYDYRVVTVNEGGRSSVAAASGRTLRNTLRAPSDLVAVASRWAIHLDWRDNSPIESAYIVERQDPGSAHFRVVGRLDEDATSFTDTVYLADGYYQYRVKAQSEDAESPAAEIGVSIRRPAESALYLPFTATVRPR